MAWGSFQQYTFEQQSTFNKYSEVFFLWAHYYLSPKWKLSTSFAYYYNKDVPDIGQFFSPEYRLTLQGMYYIHKTGYTLATRMILQLNWLI